ncbi:ACP S-malonyltransferase [Starkeya koreensis]|uniref:ACP S-malonyltransferase n=1 Tax=Ancylobacter koreensis TaxID=266121 RepID=A0ABT0DKR1_9HYPH|nr:acyltransferase domain-containing protein [Ancylobacter koreensis]MCK0207754.1 ACP S-malonyltransferase [Ancylobacter koreensis]
MALMLLCPGQGNQHPAMFERLVDEPAARPVLEMASERLGLDLRRLGGPDDRLDYADNRTAQILLTAHCLALHAVLGKETGDICIGYSVGEIAALACAGGLDPLAAFDVIDARVRCMDEASRASGIEQGMMAVIGLPLARIIAFAEGAGLAVAIVNGPDHVVLGGPAETLAGIEGALVAQGARTVKRLPVRVASHTRFIAAAGPAFRAVLEGAPLHRTRKYMLSGIDGRSIASPADAVEALAEQLHTRLDFRRCLEMAGERGARCAVEIGPGHSLTRLCAEILPDVPVRPFEDFRSTSGLLKWIERAQQAG